MSVDPLADQLPSWSPYTYTLNNPINLIDPDGRMPEPPEWLKKTISWVRENVNIYAELNFSAGPQVGYKNNFVDIGGKYAQEVFVINLSSQEGFVRKSSDDLEVEVSMSAVAGFLSEENPLGLGVSVGATGPPGEGRGGESLFDKEKKNEFFDIITPMGPYDMKTGLKTTESLKDAQSGVHDFEVNQGIKAFLIGFDIKAGIEIKHE